MKYQALFSSKDKSKKLKCRLLQFLFGSLRVKIKTIIKTKILHKMYVFIYTTYKSNYIHNTKTSVSTT